MVELQVDPSLGTVTLLKITAAHDVGRAINPQLAEGQIEGGIAQGIGLAATQVDVHERVVVIDVSEERNQPLVLINPEITWASEEKQFGDEGCLSVPGIYDGVERSTSVKVKALDENGNSREIADEGLLAICMQHEMDHLMGKVFVEYLSPLKRNRIKTKMVKAQKAAAKG